MINVLKHALYIVGTNHPLQCGASSCSSASIVEFRNEIHRICEDRNIRRIAEEMNQEGLERQDVLSTVARCVAGALGIEHQYVDLTAAERVSLGLNDAPFVANFMYLKSSTHNVFKKRLAALVADVRERIWITRILSTGSWPTLFICGADHSQSVKKLWRRFMLPVEVIHSDYVSV